MDLNRTRSSTKFYAVLLIGALMLLIFTGSMAYRQIKRMQKSADMVSHTYQVNDAIGTLFSHYFRLESEEFRKNLLEGNMSREKLRDYVSAGQIVFDSLHNLVDENASQLTHLKNIKALEGKLYEPLTIVGDSIVDEFGTVGNGAFKNGKFSQTLFEIRSINEQMRAEERRLMLSRKADYNNTKLLAPLTTLILGSFALFVFIVSFLRIYRNKQRLRRSEALLQRILSTTDNIVNYYEPILDTNTNISDFKIIFANECNRTYLGLDPEKIVGKPISKIFPHFMLNGEFEKLVQCFEKKTKIILNRGILINGEKMWFESLITPSAEGVLVTARNFTEEERAKEELISLNERLEDQNNALSEVNQQLKMQNTIFKDAENVANIGSYVWYLDTGNATISDNFYLILGLAPDAFEVSFQSYRNFVHPDDLEIYDRLRKETVELGKSTVQNYRIIDSQGNTRHLYLNGHFVEKEGRPVSLGVVQDITNRVKKNEDLRVRNVELERSNAELESFNRVTSHDLQEPLRKIQMFISRVDRDNLSEKTVEYLVNIENAATRMRSLISRLLSYSRIDSTHAAFEKVDLNTILNTVMEGLSLAISERGATVTADRLPVIQGISYQMEQLFDNLISNALKYCAPDVFPNIVIHSEMIHRDKIPENFYKSALHYHKLTFADNGIGFEQTHADKIFEVFQRLHPQSEYSGTGIGLAICKKIINNHFGFMYARGELDKGSVFILYLPA